MPHVDVNLAATIATGILFGHLGVLAVTALFRLLSGK